MSRNLILSFIVTVLVASGLSVGAWAEETLSSEMAPFESDIQDELMFLASETPMVETATKTAIPLSKAPASVTVIDSNQIRKSGARTLPELLRLVPGVNVRWNPMMQTIDIRGFGALAFTSRVLMLIDGVPYNSWNKGGFPQQPGFDFFTMENVKRVEIIKGPGSVLYGENAYWGVINILSLSGEDLDRGENGGGRLSTFGGDLKTYKVNATYGKKFDHGSILLSATQNRSQYPMEFWFKDNNSKVSGQDFFVKGKYKSIIMSYYRHSDSVDGFSSQIGPFGVFASTPEVKQTVEIAAVKVNHKTDSGKLSFGADISMARRNGMHCGACHALPQSPTNSIPEDHGYQFISDLRMGIHSIKNNDLLIGAEVRRVDAKKAAREFFIGTNAAGQATTTSYNKGAFYIQDIISLLDDKMTIIAGARYDGETHPALFNAKLSPRLAAVYNPTNALTVRAGWSKAYRTPSFTELYLNSLLFNVLSPAAVLLPFPQSSFSANPDLRPEEIQTYDVGVSYSFNPDFDMKVEAYSSQVRDFIVMTSANGLTGYENHPAKARIFGVESELKWKFGPRLTGYLNYAFQNQYQIGNTQDSTGKNIEFTYAPKHKVNSGIFFRPFVGFSGAFELAWRSKVIAPSFRDPAMQSFGDYTYVNTRFSYDLPVFQVGSIRRPLRVSVFVKNLLDKKAVETLENNNTTIAGRSFYAGIDYMF